MRVFSTVSTIIRYIFVVDESEPSRAAFHDGLDFVSVHERLLEELYSVLPPARSRQSLDVQVEAVSKARASRLQTRKAFFAVSRL